jgi:hypothetical protein
MVVFIGLDPGGSGCFGWAVVGFAPRLPLPVLATGLADDARSAVNQACQALPPREEVAAAAIDAPLVWSREGPRASDLVVRAAIRRAGAANAHGTVQSPNSLRGACLVQGVLAALELRDRFPALQITESHPKALRWLLPDARDISAGSEHERDAVLGALAAWAMWSKRPGWCDLFAEESAPLWLVPAPLSYFMPIRGAEHAEESSAGTDSRHRNRL